jgi:hypothetical protein
MGFFNANGLLNAPRLNDHVKCHALFNPFVGRYYVDGLFGVVKDAGVRGGGAR